MTIKDLAEMTMKFGLMCQKSVSSEHSYIMPTLTRTFFQRVCCRASHHNVHSQPSSAM